MLEVDVKAGGVPIGKMEIRRFQSEFGTDLDSVFNYRVHLAWTLGNPASDRHVAVKHRYGDAWPILVMAALKKILEGGCRDMQKKAPTLDDISDRLKAIKYSAPTEDTLAEAVDLVTEALKIVDGANPLVSGRTPNLGELRQHLETLKERGVASESLLFVAEQVWRNG